MEGIDLSEYIGEYLAELQEQLETLNTDLLALEEAPADEHLINEIFRIAHTIKGSAATMGFNEIASVAHAFEDVLGECREGNLTATTPLIDDSFSAFDTIKRLAGNIEADEPVEVPIDDLIVKLRSHLKPIEAPPPSPGPQPEEEIDIVGRLAQATQDAQDGQAPQSSPLAMLDEANFRIKMIFDPSQEMKSVRAFLVINHLKEIGTLVSTVPDLDAIEADRFDNSLEIHLKSESNRNEIENILLFGEAKEVEIHEVDTSAAATASPSEEGSSEEDILRMILGAAATQEKTEAPAETPAASSPASLQTPPPAEVPAVAQASPLPGTAGMVPGAKTTSVPPPPAPPPATPLAAPIKLIEQLSEDQKAVVVECINQDLNVFEISVLFRSADPQCAVRAMTIYNYLAEISRVIRSIPASKDFGPDAFKGLLQFIIATEKEVEQLRELMLAEEIEKTFFTSISLDGLNLVPLEAQGVSSPPLAIKRAAASTTRSRVDEQRMGLPTVRVTVDRLDFLMNLVGELVIRKTQFAQLFDRFNEKADVDLLQKGIAQINADLSRITSDLQNGIMKVRMVQIGQVFYRFSRLVRDLSKNLGKQVEFLIEGAETELDKTVIDEIGDPLMHLVRNALDHGIESPETRSRLGKPEKGILLLKAQHAGNHIIVETADDGAGLDPDRIKRKALQKGIYTVEDLAGLSDSEIFQIIFHPGFSTSDTVSNISGRGVGMDVVKETVERLSGDIQIKSERNVGTSIQIKLPLTLAIIQGLLVKVGKETFTIPLSTVKETVQLNELAIHVVSGHKVVNFRDEVIPIIFLREFFDVPADINNKRKRQFVVFAGVDDRKVGLVVNHLIQRSEIVIKSLDRRFCSVQGFAGATVLGDGTVSLILDIPVLVEESKRAFVTSPKAAA